MANDVLAIGQTSTATGARTRFDRRYGLGRLIASGGGACVHAAEHVFTRRAVAIKLPLDRDETRRERMRREMAALARVRGKGVVEMLDAGEVDGSPYIVLELLDGRSLDGLLVARGRLGFDDTLKVGIELAEVLARCHAQGVIHRDVKPSNIFVTAQSSPQLRLLDFGIAKLTGDAVSQPKLTRDNAVLGTPEYMAPEALLAVPDIDHRVDIYGLGVTLYECLTGTLPFAGNYADLLLKVSTTAARPVEELRPDVPKSLARTIAKSLNRTPADRFFSMDEMLAALQASATTPLDVVNLFEHRVARSRTETPETSVTDGASRRRFPRAPYTALARVTRPSGERVDGRVEEVSEGGLQFVGERAIDVSETVTLRFALPSSSRITDVSATARWNRTLRGTNATGFEFMDITDSARSEIRLYVGIMTGTGAHR